MSKMIVLNAKIFTAEPDCPWASAMVVDQDRIVAIGDARCVDSLLSSDVKIIDAEGRLILPGFIDNHCHPVAWMYKSETIDVFSCAAEEEYQTAILAYANSNPLLNVVKGAGWFYSDFSGGTPHKSILDEIISDKPVMIYSGDFHSLWVNSKALEMVGIDENTQDPQGGAFGRDKDGNLTGYINEIPAVKVIESRISSFAPEDYKRGLLTFFSQCGKAGITSIHDAGLLNEEGILAYQTVKEEEYTCRVFGSLIIKENCEGTPSEVVDEIRDLKALENRFYHCNTVKLFMDGVPEANTAMLEEAYLNEPENKGESLWKQGRFDAICEEADQQGWQIHVHAIGDRAVRMTLDSFTKAEEKNGKRDSRHMIAHLQLVNDSDVDRMAALGVVAVPTAFWFEKSAMYYQVELFNLGKERADGEYKMKRLLNAGILTACGSDSPVGISAPVTEVPFAPVLAIQQGVTRCNVFQDADNLENVLNPSERVSVEDMVRTYTINGAKANFAEDELGSLKVGKKADFIMLDQNIFEIPVQEIYKTTVLMTVVDGRVVFQA